MCIFNNFDLKMDMFRSMVSRVKNLSMEFHGFPWKILQGIPPRSRTSISMEFHGNFSIDFHGKHQDSNFHGIPWKFLHQYFPWRIRTFSMEFHGKAPCNSIETTPSIIPWISREFHGIHWNQTLKYPVNQMEYITDFGPLQFI